MAPTEAGPVEPVKLLLIDDKADNRAALGAILSSADYRLVEASSALEGLRRLLDEEFAVLLVDVVMPEMSGFEFAAAVKARVRTAEVPIIFLTGQASDVDYAYKGYQVGAVDYLVKPIMPEMVRAKVAVFVELYRQRKRLDRQGALLLEAERKENELRLIEMRLGSERRYRALAEAIPHIVWTAGPAGRVDYFNRRWFEYTGLSQEDTGGSWQGALHPDDLARCRAAWEDALRSGQMLEAECRLRQSRGDYRWHLCRAAPERSTTGQILSWLGTFTDIEDQKRAEGVLAEFKGTLDAVLDAVLIFDPQSWRFLYVNQGASALLGYSREELRRMRPIDVMIDLDEDGFRDLLAPLQDGTEAIITIDTQIRRRDFRTVPVEVSLQFIRIDGGRIVSIARDITDRKRAQLERELLYREAVDAVRARDEFLSVASHELKTPVAALQLQLQMLLREGAKTPPGPERTKAKVELVARQVDRLTRLIGELMDVSRITAGRLRLELEEIDLSATVRDVVSRYGEEAARAGAPVRLFGEGPTVGRWDRLRLEQVITNLLTNAMKFGPGKPIEITVEEMGPQARLTIADHGIGIAAEDADRIFQRYEQAQSPRAIGGLGLGLYIVRQIVEAHGGTVSVESQPGAGSTFTVDLPRQPVPPTKELSSTPTAEGEESESEREPPP